MPEPSHPSAVAAAREAIRLLAERRIAPTPDNYAAVYREVVGNDEGSAGLGALRMLERLAEGLPHAVGAAGAYERLLAARRWDELQTLIARLVARGAGPERGDEWPDLIRDLLRRWEARQPGLTVARKRESLEHVLTAFGSDPAKLLPRLRGLVKSWGEGVAPGGDGPAAAESGMDRTAAVLREMLSHTLRHGVVGRLGFSPQLAEEAEVLSARAAAASSSRELESLDKLLRSFWLRLEISGESQADLSRTLASLLALVAANMEELAAGDGWAQGQIAELKRLLEEPLTVQAVRDAERTLRALVYRQSMSRQALDEAREALKAMLATFLDRLAAMALASGEYEARLARHAEEIERTQDLSRLGDIVAALALDARAVQADAVRMHDELQAARSHAASREARVRELEHALAQASEELRHDAVTRALNRRGLADAFAAEAARCDRAQKRLGFALLDVDDLKPVNERFGRAAGDGALAHLATVLRGVLRPADTVARYGGKEFVVLMPEVTTSEACALIVRAQRALTRQIYLHQNERLLVTFSAGVALRAAGEPEEEVVARADAALGHAKRLGRNRVAAAEPDALPDPPAG